MIRFDPTSNGGLEALLNNQPRKIRPRPPQRLEARRHPVRPPQFARKHPQQPFSTFQRKYIPPRQILISNPRPLVSRCNRLRNVQKNRVPFPLPHIQSRQLRKPLTVKHGVIFQNQRIRKVLRNQVPPNKKVGLRTGPLPRIHVVRKPLGQIVGGRRYPAKHVHT